MNKKILDGFKKQKILVVGDIMMDEYIKGEVERISPEAPIPVVNVMEENYVLGGAGNVACNLKTLSCGSVYIAGVIGDDLTGDWIRQDLKRWGIEAEGMFVDPGRVTTKKTRVIAVNQQTIRIDRETREEISSKVEKDIVDYISDNIGIFNGVLISDYLKGVLTKRLLKTLIETCRTHGVRVRVVIDPKGKDYSRYRGAYILTPNKRELEAIANKELMDNSSIIREGKRLMKNIKVDAILITRGREGVTVIEEADAYHLPARAREVYDVTGAGDTFLSVLGLTLFSGASLREASELANIGAGIVVGKFGTATINSEELNYQRLKPVG